MTPPITAAAAMPMIHPTFADDVVGAAGVGVTTIGGGGSGRGDRIGRGVGGKGERIPTGGGAGGGIGLSPADIGTAGGIARNPADTGAAKRIRLATGSEWKFGGET